MRVLQWLHLQPPNSYIKQTIPLELVFPDGPHPSKEVTLDIVVANAEGMFYLIL